MYGPVQPARTPRGPAEDEHNGGPSMPTAREQLADARLYLCTDARRRQGDLPEFLDAVLSSGVDIVQLRDKGMEAAEELDHLAVFADACRRHGKLLAVNDRADVAHAIGADVLHLGQGDLPVPAAQAILGRRGADRPLHTRRSGGRRGRVPAGRRLLLHRPVLAHPDQAGPPRPRSRPGAPHRLAPHRPALVRHRRHRRGQPGAGP